MPSEDDGRTRARGHEGTRARDAMKANSGDESTILCEREGARKETLADARVDAGVAPGEADGCASESGDTRDFAAVARFEFDMSYSDSESDLVARVSPRNLRAAEAVLRSKPTAEPPTRRTEARGGPSGGPSTDVSDGARSRRDRATGQDTNTIRATHVQVKRAVDDVDVQRLDGGTAPRWRGAACAVQVFSTTLKRGGATVEGPRVTISTGPFTFENILWTPPEIPRESEGRNSGTKFAWIEKRRVAEFVTCVQKYYDRKYIALRTKKSNYASVFARTKIFSCECGPQDARLTCTEIQARAMMPVPVPMKRISRRHVGESKKCGCVAQIHVRDVNKKLLSFKGANVDAYVRVVLQGEHCCKRATVNTLCASTRKEVEQLLIRHPEATDIRISRLYRQSMKERIMIADGIKPEEFQLKLLEGQVRVHRDYHVTAQSIRNIRRKFDATTYKLHDNEGYSLVSIFFKYLSALRFF